MLLISRLITGKGNFLGMLTNKVPESKVTERVETGVRECSILELFKIVVD